VRDGKVLRLPSYEEVSTDVRAFSEMSRAFQHETNPGNGRPLPAARRPGPVLQPAREPLDTKD
jgi:hypothetical protein